MLSEIYYERFLYALLVLSHSQRISIKAMNAVVMTYFLSHLATLITIHVKSQPYIFCTFLINFLIKVLATH